MCIWKQCFLYMEFTTVFLFFWISHQLILFVLNQWNSKTFSGAVNILKKCLCAACLRSGVLLLESSEFSLAWRQPEEYEKGLKSKYGALWLLEGWELIIFFRGRADISILFRIYGQCAGENKSMWKKKFTTTV